MDEEEKKALYDETVEKYEFSKRRITFFVKILVLTWFFSLVESVPRSESMLTFEYFNVLDLVNLLMLGFIINHYFYKFVKKSIEKSFNL